MPKAPRWLVNLFAFSGLALLIIFAVYQLSGQQWIALTIMSGIYFVIVVAIGVWQGLARYGRE